MISIHFLHLNQITLRRACSLLMILAMMNVSTMSSAAEEAPPPLHDHAGEVVELKAEVGKRLYVVFWCSWCPSVTMQVSRIAEALRENLEAGDAVVGVSLDQNDENFKKAIASHGDKMAGWRHIHANDELIRDWVQAAGVNALPAIAIYNDTGERFEFHGSVKEFMDARKLENLPEAGEHSERLVEATAMMHEFAKADRATAGYLFANGDIRASLAYLARSIGRHPHPAALQSAAIILNQWPYLSPIQLTYNEDGDCANDIGFSPCGSWMVLTHRQTESEKSVSVISILEPHRSVRLPSPLGKTDFQVEFLDSETIRIMPWGPLYDAVQPVKNREWSFLKALESGSDPGEFLTNASNDDVTRSGGHEFDGDQHWSLHGITAEIRDHLLVIRREKESVTAIEIQLPKESFQILAGRFSNCGTAFVATVRNEELFGIRAWSTNDGSLRLSSTIEHEHPPLDLSSASGWAMSPYGDYFAAFDDKWLVIGAIEKDTSKVLRIDRLGEGNDHGSFHDVEFNVDGVLLAAAVAEVGIDRVEESVGRVYWAPTGETLGETPRINRYRGISGIRWSPNGCVLVVRNHLDAESYETAWHAPTSSLYRRLSTSEWGNRLEEPRDQGGMQPPAPEHHTWVGCNADASWHAYVRSFRYDNAIITLVSTPDGTKTIPLQLPSRSFNHLSFSNDGRGLEIEMHSSGHRERYTVVLLDTSQEVPDWFVDFLFACAFMKFNADGELVTSIQPGNSYSPTLTQMIRSDESSYGDFARWFLDKGKPSSTWPSGSINARQMVSKVLRNASSDVKQAYLLDSSNAKLKKALADQSPNSLALELRIGSSQK